MKWKKNGNLISLKNNRKLSPHSKSIIDLFIYTPLNHFPSVFITYFFSSENAQMIEEYEQKCQKLKEQLQQQQHQFEEQMKQLSSKYETEIQQMHHSVPQETYDRSLSLSPFSIYLDLTHSFYIIRRATDADKEKLIKEIADLRELLQKQTNELQETQNNITNSIKKVPNNISFYSLVLGPILNELS
jgi:predicted S18 family serine protease